MYPSEMVLICPSPYARDTYFIEGGEWEIIANSTSTDGYNLFLRFVLKRKPLFAIINVILPIVLLSALNVLVFVLPAESGERVSYSITVLLSIAVFLTLVADNLPKTSQPMSVLAFFLMVNLANSSLICFATILNLRCFYKKETHPVPAWLKMFVRLLTCRLCRGRSKVFGKNEVVPVDIKPGKKTDLKANQKDNLNNQEAEINISGEEPITWQDVASLIDVILLITFIISSLVTVIVFVVILVRNKGALSTEEED